MTETRFDQSLTYSYSADDWITCPGCHYRPDPHEHEILTPSLFKITCPGCKHWYLAEWHDEELNEIP